MIKLETERLIIRNFKSDDWKDIAVIAMDYEQSEYAIYDHGPWPSNQEEYKGIAEWFVKGDDFAAILLKEEEKLIGWIAKGKIENKGNISDEGGENSSISYGFVLQTSSEKYDLIYQNGTCQLTRVTTLEKKNITSFSVDESLLIITFLLTNASETYELIEAKTVEFEPPFFGYLDFAFPDNIPPLIQIITPDNALYINNKRIFSFPIPLIFGDIEIEVHATDDYRMSLVSFHINDELKNITYYEPYSWMWDETTFGKQTIKVVAFDYARNRAIKEITVWKFF